MTAPAARRAWRSDACSSRSKADNPSRPFLRFGDRVRVEMFDSAGRSIFGAIDQRVVAAPPRG